MCTQLTLSAAGGGSRSLPRDVALQKGDDWSRTNTQQRKDGRARSESEINFAASTSRDWPEHC